VLPDFETSSGGSDRCGPYWSITEQRVTCSGEPHTGNKARTKQLRRSSPTPGGFPLFVGTVDERTVVLAGQMFGDNFKPVPVELRIESRPTARKMTMDDLDEED
jgi:hypothetical protein